MHNLIYFLIGGLLIGALAFGAISSKQKNITNTSNNQTYVDSTEEDSPDYNAENRSLQLKTFDPGTVNVGGGSCTPGGKVAYNFLLDTSSSMTAASDGRFGNMKKDVVAFISKLQPDSVVSVQAFDNRPREVVTPTFFKDIDSKYSGKINSLKPTESTAGTNTSGGLAGAKRVIDANKAKFPGYNWSLILVTDGCPNSVDGPMGLNIANQVRDSGISLLGYGIKLGTAGKCDKLTKKLGLPQGTKPIEAAKVLMEKITGGKDNYSLTETETLTSFLGKVPNKTCPIPTKTQACTPTNAPNLELLVDNSGSMESSMPKLKEALTNFGKNLKSTNIVGLHSFSGGGPKGVLQERFRIGEFDQASFDNGIRAMSHDDDGATYIKDAFELTAQKIEDYDTDSDYSEWAMVFLSDGNPKVLGGPDDDPAQDPSDIVTELKNKNMRIVSIALGNQIRIDKMKKIATDPSKDFFEAKTADELNSIYSNVFKAINCQ